MAYPPGVTDNDPHFDLPSVGDDRDCPEHGPRCDRCVEADQQDAPLHLVIDTEKVDRIDTFDSSVVAVAEPDTARKIAAEQSNYKVYVPSEVDTQPRTFPDVLNQWTEEVIKLNAEAGSIEQIALILRLGTLGQRLLYEANTLGMNEALKMATERMRDG